MLKNYRTFVGINENYQQAKKWLLDQIKVGDKIEDQQAAKMKIFNDKTNPISRKFHEISELLKNKQGWLFPFVIFYMEENIPFNDIKSLYERLEKIHNKRMISDLPKDPSQYWRKDEGEIRSRFEQLDDDTKFIEMIAGAIDFSNKKFPGTLKLDFKQTLERVKKEKDRLKSDGIIKSSLADYIPTIEDKVIKNDFISIDKFITQVKKLDEIEKTYGKNSDVVTDFYKKVSKFTMFEEFLKSVDMFIESLESGFAELLDKIKRFNGTKNDMYKIKIVYPETEAGVIEKNIGLFEYNTFQASKIMGSQSWCIVTNLGHWNNYVGGDNVYRRQYVIHNHELPTTDRKWMIGITMDSDGKYYTAHDFNDSKVEEVDLKAYCEKYDIPYSILQRPVTKELKDAKDLSTSNTKKLKAFINHLKGDRLSSEDSRILGEYSNVKEISIEVLEEFKNSYADFSANNNALLAYVVSLDDANNEEKHKKAMELTTYCLENGAFAEGVKTLDKAKTTDMIELLIKYGAEASQNFILLLLNNNDMDLLRYMFNRTDFLIKKYPNNRVGELMKKFKESYIDILGWNYELMGYMAKDIEKSKNETERKQKETAARSRELIKQLQEEFNLTKDATDKK